MKKTSEKRALRLSISRVSAGNGDDRIRIEVAGDSRLSKVCRLSVGLEEFTLALTGRSDVECDGVVWTEVEGI